MSKAWAVFLSLAALAAITLGGRAAGNLYRTGTPSLARDPVAVMGLGLPDALSMLKADAAIKGMVTGVEPANGQWMLQGWAFDPSVPTKPVRVVVFDSRAFSTANADTAWTDPAAAVAAGAPPLSAFNAPLAHCAAGAPLQAIAVTADARYAALPFGAVPGRCP